MTKNLTFQQFLSRNKSKKIFIDPCSGNNGDLLIWEGMKTLVRRENISPISAPESSDLIIINGGGNFIDAYKQGINKVLEYSEKYPGTTLCIAPNSFCFNSVDFGKILDVRQAELIIFCRELYSKQYIDKLIENRALIKSYIDHDLAFNLENSELISEYLDKLPKTKRGNVLVVDRMDLEHQKYAGKISILKKIYITTVPKYFKNILRNFRFRLRNRNGTELTKRALDFLDKEYPSIKIVNVETKDISRIDVCDFQEFSQKIIESEFIFTNRLHVGILGHLLDKKVYMLEGSYHKIQGIYEYSMKGKKTTKIWNI